MDSACLADILGGASVRSSAASMPGLRTAGSADSTRAGAHPNALVAAVGSDITARVRFRSLANQARPATWMFGVSSQTVVAYRRRNPKTNRWLGWTDETDAEGIVSNASVGAWRITSCDGTSVT
jgi:hypothetical protein